MNRRPDGNVYVIRVGADDTEMAQAVQCISRCAGGLLSHTADRRAIAQITAVFVDKILKGAKPADLPVEQPTNFELIVNLKAARTPGLTIPPTLLGRADEVIE